MPEISIIVPVYNVEKYLRQCLQSIQDQTFQDWECIVVNDESPDNSAKIIDEFVKSDNRFKVVNRKNGGLSAARNSGLEIATGKYIGFVDADDWADPKMYETLHDLITEHNADVSQVSYHKDYDGFTHDKAHRGGVIVYNSRREFVKQLFLDYRIRNYMWNKLFRREVITEPFPEGKVFEDIYTISHWAENIHKVVISSEMLYHYRFRQGSIANLKAIKNKEHYLESRIKQLELFEQLEPGFVSRDLINRASWKSALYSTKDIARMRNIPLQDRLDAMKNIMEICRSNFGEPQRAQLGASKYNKIRLLQNNPKLFVKLQLFLYSIDFHTQYRLRHAFK